MPHRRQQNPGGERRRAPRHPAARLPKLHVSILAGPDLTVLDVSPHGLLVESDVRLIPGAEICLTIKFPDQSYMVGGRVARVETVMSGAKLNYRAGIALDGAFAPFDLPMDSPAAAEPLPAAPAAKRGSDHKRADRAAPAAGHPGEGSVEALRHTLEEQRKRSEHGTWVIEMLKAALRSSEQGRKDAEAEHQQQRENWQRERRSLEQTIEIAARHKDKLSAELSASLTSRRTAVSDIEQQRAAAEAERARVQEQLEAANHRLGDAVGELDTLRGKYACLERTLDEERAMLASLLQEKDAMLAELETLRAAAEGLSRERDQAHEERARAQIEQKRLAEQLQTAERWCTDQNELIYELWQQALRSTSLIENWQSARTRKPTNAPDGVRPSPGAEPGRETNRTPDAGRRSGRSARSLTASPAHADE